MEWTIENHISLPMYEDQELLQQQHCGLSSFNCVEGFIKF